MTPRFALALLAGLALGAAATGASSALTAMPAPLIVAFGAAAAAFAFSSSRFRLSAGALLACGVMLGTTLPRETPRTSGTVITRGVPGARSGDLFALLDQIDADPQAVLGRRVTVAGEWSRTVRGRPATVSRGVMTCCAADMVRVGFDVIPVQAVEYRDGTPVRVTGILRAAFYDGDTRYAIVAASVVSAPSATP